MTHGPATRGIRRSLGSRSGLSAASRLSAAAITPGFAGAGPRVPAIGTVMSEPPVPLFLQAQLVPDGLDHLVPRGGELRDALLLKHPHHVVVADSELLQGGEDLAGYLVVAVHRVAAEHAVGGHGVQGRL